MQDYWRAEGGVFELREIGVRSIAVGALVAALYAALTIWLAPLSYGPVQVRVSEALTVLPFLVPAAVPGLFLGCLIANLYGGLGPWDIFAGSLLTLAAAYLTYLLRKTHRPWLAPLPPVVINAFGVSAYLQLLFEPPKMSILGNLPGYFIFVITVGLGELVACCVLGLPLLYVLRGLVGGSTEEPHIG
jgi:uncharacterized membrane protein